MISFTKRYVNIVSLIISIIIFCFLNNHILNNNLKTNTFLLSSKVQQISKDIEYSTNFLNQNKAQEEYQEIENSEKLNQENQLNQDEKTNQENQHSQNQPSVEENKRDFVWQIEIPSINLNALISEGTSKEVMDEFVGHFEETVKREGNVGLAAHNRGYKVNYFQDLKKLKEGDEIIYKYKEFEKRYVVKTLKIISDEDWSLLENTEDNRITLITCVENEPNYRRVVQGIEMIHQ